MEKLKRVMSIFLIICLCTSLSGCGNSSGGKEEGTTAAGSGLGETGSSGQEGGHSRIANIALSENLLKMDPADQAVVVGTTYCAMIYDALVTGDHEGNYEPSLAKEWAISDDGLTWTFKLQEGVEFSNGEAFTADDVVCTFKRIQDNPTLYMAANSWKTLKSMEKIDDYTCELHLTEPSGTVLLDLTNTWIIPDGAYAEKGDALFTDQMNYGTGPWKFDQWIDGQYVHFFKNENYWNGGNNSYFDEVYLRFVLEPSTAISGQISGTIDAYIASGGISADLISMYDGSEDKIEVIALDSGTIDYMGFQCKEGSPFADENVRKAFSMAIDRNMLIDSIMGGGTLPIGITTNVSMGYDEALTSDNYKFDPEMAKTLLAASGYSGEEIVISSNVATTNAESLLLAISEMVNAVGFNSSIEVLESAALMDKRSTGDYDVFLVAAMHGSGDLYAFTNLRILNDAHHSNYVNKELNGLIEKSNVESDQNVRNELFKQINQIVVDECAPMITVCQLKSYEAVSYGITGIDLFADGFFVVQNVDYDPSLITN